MSKQTLTEWQEEMMEQVRGTVFITCIMDSVPYHENTKRYQVYNEENTFNKTFDITLNEGGFITNIK